MRGCESFLHNHSQIVMFRAYVLEPSEPLFLLLARIPNQQKYLFAALLYCLGPIFVLELFIRAAGNKDNILAPRKAFERCYSSNRSSSARVVHECDALHSCDNLLPAGELRRMLEHILN